VLIGIFALFGIGVDTLWRYFFPPIHFDWGQEKKRLEKIAQTRDKIFWGILVSIIIGLIMNFFLTRAF